MAPSHIYDQLAKKLYEQQELNFLSMLSTNKFFSLHIVLIVFLMVTAKCNTSWFTPIIVPYKLSEPDQKFRLSNKLNEVSGINVTRDGKAVLIDDEIGSLFYYSLSTQKTIDTVAFSKTDNWEDLYVTNDTVYVLRNSGELAEVTRIKGDTAQVKIRIVNTGLHVSNDAEGLCYDKESKLFLIACKGNPGLKNSTEKYKGRKAIYGYNFKTGHLNSTPVFLINVHKVESMILGTQTNLIRRIMNLFNVPTKSVFQPAGIAIHPISGDIYVISAVGKVLILLDRKGTIKAARKLPPKLFTQPEGIAFDTAGNMFISNEERSGVGNILKFSSQ
jgi:hypothetical protein